MPSISLVGAHLPLGISRAATLALGNIFSREEVQARLPAELGQKERIRFGITHSNRRHPHSPSALAQVPPGRLTSMDSASYTISFHQTSSAALQKAGCPE